MRIPTPCFGQLKVILTATIIVISDGMHYSWSSAGIVLLQKEDSPVGRITEEDSYWIEEFYWFGAIFGIFLTIFTVEKFGRKNSLLLSSSLTLISWILIAISGDIRMIFGARFICGLTSSVTFNTAPMYIAECAEAKFRGFLISTFFTFMMVGSLMSYSIVPFVPIWISSCIGIGINFTHLVSFSFMPESPYYLLMKEDKAGAQNSLRKLRDNPDVTNELISIESAVSRQSQEKGTIKDLFTVSSNRKALIMVVILRTLQHLCGITVILMNVEPIFIKAGTHIEPRITSILFGTCMLITLILSSIFVDKFGRKFLMIASCIFSSVTLALLGGFFLAQNKGYEIPEEVALTAIIFYAIANRIGLGTVPSVINGEIFPTSVKALGMNVSSLVYVLTAIISIKIYYWTTEEWGLHIPFLVFAICTFIGAIYVYFCVPETKGKTLEEIQLKLKNQSVEKETY